MFKQQVLCCSAQINETCVGEQKVSQSNTFEQTCNFFYEEEYDVNL